MSTLFNKDYMKTIPVNNVNELADYLTRLITLDVYHHETLSESDQAFIKIIDEFPDAKFLIPDHVQELFQKIQEHNKTVS